VTVIEGGNLQFPTSVERVLDLKSEVEGSPGPDKVSLLPKAEQLHFLKIRETLGKRLL